MKSQRDCCSNINRNTDGDEKLKWNEMQKKKKKKMRRDEDEWRTKEIGKIPSEELLSHLLLLGSF